MHTYNDTREYTNKLVYQFAWLTNDRFALPCFFISFVRNCHIKPD